jgi:hypothetical protein
MENFIQARQIRPCCQSLRMSSLCGPVSVTATCVLFKLRLQPRSLVRDTAAHRPSPREEEFRSRSQRAAITRICSTLGAQHASFSILGRGAISEGPILLSPRYIFAHQTCRKRFSSHSKGTTVPFVFDGAVAGTSRAETLIGRFRTLFGQQRAN